MGTVTTHSNHLQNATKQQVLYATMCIKKQLLHLCCEDYILLEIWEEANINIDLVVSMGEDAGFAVLYIELCI